MSAVLVVHLSDIHVQSENDAVLSRAPEIVAALRSISPIASRALILVSGDIAYSGTEWQYLVADDKLFSPVRERLGAHLGGEGRPSAPIDIIPVPGNHDCNFEGTSVVRDAVRRMIIEDHDHAADLSVQDTALSVQEDFFAFRQSVAPPEWQQGHESYDSRLYHRYDVSTGDGSIVVHCVNTAWLSRIQERAGSLLFPVDAIATPQPGSDRLDIVMMHHPYNWLEPTNGQAFRTAIERLGDWVLTGHEHISDTHETRARGSIHQTHTAGGVLQETGDPSVSSFHAWVVDLRERKQKFFPFSWSGDHYSIDEELATVAAASEIDWSPIPMTSVAERVPWAISDEMQHHLRDPGLTLHTREGDPLTLSDVFVFPDLRVKEGLFSNTSRYVNGERARAELATNHVSMLAGPTLSGKSAVAKDLFRYFHQQGRVPLLIQGKSARTRSWRRTSRDEVQRQYSKRAVTAYEQLPVSERVVIIDDYHAVLSTVRERMAFLREISAFAGTIILTIDGLVRDSLSLSPEAWESPVDVVSYDILPFGYRRRQDLVEQWLRLHHHDDNAETFVRTLHALTKTMDGLIGKNFVPAYPVYLFAVMQAAELSLPIDNRASAYGYFYEILIRSSLARDGKREEFDILFTYLSFVAYEMRRQSVSDISEQSFRTIHDSYEQEYALRESFTAMTDSLLTRNIISRDGDLYAFRYPYIRYYFVAAYMRDHLSAADVRLDIKHMAEALDDDENSNILLFLVHLTKDDYVLDKLLSATRGIFSTVAEEQLERTSISVVPPRLQVYEERDPVEVRREEATRRDDQDRSDKIEETSQDTIDEFGRALKTNQIMGQILKNFPGSLDGTRKEMIAKETFGVALRAMGWLLETIRSDEDDLLGAVTFVIRKQQPRLSSSEAEQKARAMLGLLLMSVAFGLIREVVQNAGSKHLLVTYGRILDADPRATMQLIKVALALETSSTFPREEVRSLARTFTDNPVALEVLRYLVIHHFHLFVVDPSVKQSVCAILDISFPAIETTRREWQRMPRS